MGGETRRRRQGLDRVLHVSDGNLGQPSWRRAMLIVIAQVAQALDTNREHRLCSLSARNAEPAHTEQLFREAQREN